MPLALDQKKPAFKPKHLQKLRFDYMVKTLRSTFANFPDKRSGTCLTFTPPFTISSGRPHEIEVKRKRAIKARGRESIRLQVRKPCLRPNPHAMPSRSDF